MWDQGRAVASSPCAEQGSSGLREVRPEPKVRAATEPLKAGSPTPDDGNLRESIRDLSMDATTCPNYFTNTRQGIEWSRNNVFFSSPSLPYAPLSSMFILKTKYS